MINVFSKNFWQRHTPQSPQQALSKELQKQIKDDPTGFMVNIVKQQFSLYKKEIEHWQMARALAKQTYLPRRTILYQLYEDIMTDPFIYGQWQNRANRITNKNFKVVGFTDRKENLNKTNLFKKAWFYDFLTYALESRREGYSLPYVSKLIGTEIKAIELAYREHVLPEAGQIIFSQGDVDGPSFLDGDISKYCVGVGKPKDLGLLEKIAPLYILKKHSWQSWDQFEEMFGMPIRIAKTASQDKRVQAMINEWLQDLGSAGHAVFPAGTELDIKESTRSDAFAVFENKRKACNEEIAIIINGQFETSNNSGSKAKTKSVVESTQDEITDDDLRFLYYVINDQLIPMMQGLGYDINADDWDFEWDSTVELKPLEKIQIYKNINDMGFQLDQNDVATTFGVKITGVKAPVIPPPGEEPEPIEGNDEPADGDEPLQNGKLVNPKKLKTDVEQLLKMHVGIANLYKQPSDVQ